MRSVCINTFLIITSSTLWKLVLAVPSGFREETVLSIQPGQGTCFDLTTNGKLFISEKQGKVQVYNFNNGNPNDHVTALDIVLGVCTNGDRGIQSVTAHPDFENNGFVYVFYTHKKHGHCGTDGNPDAPVDRLSRYKFENNRLVDETVLLEIRTHRRNHAGGGVIFGNDGKIWCTVGDHGLLAEPQADSNLLGTLMRVNDDGSIPGDNPYKGNPRCNVNGYSPNDTPCPEIWANGLRSPFSVNNNNNKKGITEFMINDVGASHWESSYMAGTQYRMANYGWREREGLCKAHTSVDCNNYPEKYELPYHFYGHGSGGFAAMTAGAFVPDGWKSDYNGCYFYGDFVRNKIYIMCDGGQACFSCNPPESDKVVEVFSEFSSVVAMKFLPYGEAEALYYISFYAGQFRRIWKTDDDNEKPYAQISYDYDLANSGFIVSFDGGESNDPDGRIILYSWNFGDESSTGSGTEISHVYSKSGVYQVILTVRDDKGKEDSDTVNVQVGKPPEAKINFPGHGDTFAVGDTFNLKGSATDGNGKTLTGASLKWKVLQWHGNLHTHEYISADGEEVTAQDAPGPEDPYSTETSYLEVQLTATDGNGLSTTVSQDYWPKLAEISFTTDPTGLKVILHNGFPFSSPVITLTTWLGYSLSVEAPAMQSLNEKNYEFVSWSNGGNRQHNIVIETNNIPLKATYKQIDVAAQYILLNKDSGLAKGDSTSSTPSGYSMTLGSDCMLSVRSNGSELAKLGRSSPGDICTLNFQGDCHLLLSTGKFGYTVRSGTSDPLAPSCFLAVFPIGSQLNLGIFYGTPGSHGLPEWSAPF